MTEEAQAYAIARHAISGVAGALVMFGLMKSVDVNSLLAALDQINDGIGKIIVDPWAARSGDHGVDQRAQSFNQRAGEGRPGLSDRAGSDQRPKGCRGRAGRHTGRAGRESRVGGRASPIRRRDDR